MKPIQAIHEFSVEILLKKAVKGRRLVEEVRKLTHDVSGSFPVMETGDSGGIIAGINSERPAENLVIKVPENGLGTGPYQIFPKKPYKKFSISSAYWEGGRNLLNVDETRQEVEDAVTEAKKTLEHRLSYFQPLNVQ